MTNTPHDPPYTCSRCRLPILPDQPIHGAMWDHDERTGMHWNCSSSSDEARTALGRDVQRLEELRTRTAASLQRLCHVLRGG